MDAVVQVAEAPPSIGRPRVLNGPQTIVIGNGIPARSFNVDRALQTDPEIGRFCEGAFIIGSVGRLSEEKGWEYLIEALSLLVDKDVHYKAVIIGDGDRRNLIERKTQELGLTGHILLTGYKKEACDYLPLFDVFVLPSLTEGLPITLLEAMQSERPVVATNVGGVQRVLGNGECGVIVKPGDPHGLADAVSFVREGPERAREMAKRGKMMALGRYSSRRMAENYMKVYQGLTAPFKRANSGRGLL
jgi:glycosyltransferase involved in cell wall biosynthesis